jgi:hypothetical protein
MLTNESIGKKGNGPTKQKQIREEVHPIKHKG